MIELGIVDLSAEARRRIAALVEKWTWTSPESRATFPRLSVHLLAPEELRFNGSLDVCVVGPELITTDAAFIQTVRQQLPDKLILCILSQQSYSFGLVEQLGRLGVDDVLLESATPDEFFRRLILLQRRFVQRKKGRLVLVDSARGGVGVTFIAAGIAEGYLSKGARTCIVDGDVASQDLTRFLQVRPHVSEPLRLIIDQQRVATRETVAECAVPVWQDEPKIVCVPPPACQDETVLAHPRAVRALVAVLDTLQSQHEAVVVDLGAFPSVTRAALYQVADEVVFVTNRDPSGAFACRNALHHFSSCMRADASLVAVINDNSISAATLDVFTSEALVVPGRKCREVVIARDAKAGRWACSGCTPYQFLNRSFDKILDLAVVDDRESQSSLWGWAATLARSVQGIRSGLRSRKNRGTEAETKFQARSEFFPVRELGYQTGEVEDGALVSKPVLLS